MKKWLTLGLSLLAVIAALSLSACGQQESAAPESGSAPTTSGETATPAEGGAGSTTEGGSGAAPAEPATGGGQ